MTPIPKTEDYHRLRLIGLRGLKSLERKLRADSENSLMVSGMHKDATSKILVPVLTPLKDSSDWIDESRDLLCNIFEHCISLAHFRDLSLSASHFIAKNLSGGSVECEQNARKLIEVMMESASQSCAGSFAATMLTSALVSQLDLLNDLKSILVIFSLIEHLIAHTNLMRLEIILDLDHLLQHIVQINVKFMDRGEPADTATRTIINTLTTFCTNQCFLHRQVWNSGFSLNVPNIAYLNQTLQCFVHIASVRQISALVRPSLVAISEYFCRSIDLEFRPDKHSVCSLVELSSEDARLSSLCFDILTSLVDQHRLTDLAYTRIRSGNHRDCLPGPISKTILELMDDQFSFDQCWTFVLDTIRNQSILIVKSKDLCKLLCAFLYEFVFFRPKISGPRSAELSLFQYPYIKKTISDVVEIVSKYNDTRLFIYTFIDSLTKGIDAINSSASVIVERVLKWTGFNRSLDSESPAGFLSPQRSRKAATDATHPESSIKHGALKLIMSGKRSEEKRKVNLFDDMANTWPHKSLMEDDQSPIEHSDQSNKWKIATAPTKYQALNIELNDVLGKLDKEGTISHGSIKKLYNSLMEDLNGFNAIEINGRIKDVERRNGRTLVSAVNCVVEKRLRSRVFKHLVLIVDMPENNDYDDDDDDDENEVDKK
ncbi:hypothetical protein ACOME3_006082 [Neoechinorhynchus agilis]